MSDLERNKQNAVAFYDLAFNQCRPKDAIARYAGTTYIQHNPGVADGKQAFIDYFESRTRGLNGREHQLRPQATDGRGAEQEVPTVKRREFQHNGKAEPGTGLGFI